MQVLTTNSTLSFPSSGHTDSSTSTIHNEPVQAVPSYLKELESYRRKRSSSFFSTTSTTSSIFDFYHRLTPKTQPSITTTSNAPHPPGARKNHTARGSFVPSPTAAASTLRLFLSQDICDPYEHQNFHIPRGRPRRTRDTSFTPEQPHTQPKGVMPPFITRSLSISSSRTPSNSPPPRLASRHRKPASGSAISSGSVIPPDLHPILAKLERDSKFCKTKDTCSTCGEVGSNYPRCGRCGEAWCSRECRVGQAKRHTCRRVT